MDILSTVLIGLLFLVILAVVMLSMSTLATGVPSVPTRNKELKTLLEVSAVKPGELVYDLGTGEGRVLKAFQQRGAKIRGWEINPIVWLAASLRLGFGKVSLSSFWQADPSKADIIIVFLLPSIMGRIEEEIYPRMKRGARLVSNFFPLPNIRPTQVAGKVYLYEK